MLLRTISAAESTAPALDMTPIIDIVFNLLIFFLIASSFQQVEREMKVALPQARASGPMSTALREIIVNVTQDGAIIVAGKTLDEAALNAMVTAAVGANPGQKVSVRGDRNAAYGKVARVLDICKQAGISEPYLQTIPTE